MVNVLLFLYHEKDLFGGLNSASLMPSWIIGIKLRLTTQKALTSHGTTRKALCSPLLFARRVSVNGDAFSVFSCLYRKNSIKSKYYSFCRPTTQRSDVKRAVGGIYYKLQLITQIILDIYKICLKLFPVPKQEPQSVYVAWPFNNARHRQCCPHSGGWLLMCKEPNKLALGLALALALTARP